MKIGYARVSTQDQDLALQLDALTGSVAKKKDKPENYACDLIDYVV
jgi:DNA invertase Pin-like site-specific DNA recombinase